MNRNRPNLWGSFPGINAELNNMIRQNAMHPNKDYSDEEEFDQEMNGDSADYDEQQSPRKKCPYYTPYPPQPPRPPYPPKPPCPPTPPRPPYQKYIEPCECSREQMLYIYQQLAACYAGLTATIITFDGSTITGIISGAFNPTRFPAYIVLTVAAINYNVLIDRIAFIDITNTTAQPLTCNESIRQTAAETQLREVIIGTLDLLFIGSPLTTIANATVAFSYPGIIVFTYSALGITHVVYASICSILAYS